MAQTKSGKRGTIHSIGNASTKDETKGLLECVTDCGGGILERIAALHRSIVARMGDTRRFALGSTVCWRTMTNLSRR